MRRGPRRLRVAQGGDGIKCEEERGERHFNPFDPMKTPEFGTKSEKNVA